MSVIGLLATLVAPYFPGSRSPCLPPHIWSPDPAQSSMPPEGGVGHRLMKERDW